MPVIIAVPVFDGRETQFELNESLEHLDTLLPAFNDEIPPGSLALVAYTANAYYRTRVECGHELEAGCENPVQGK